MSEHLKLILSLRGVRPVPLRVVTRIAANPQFKSIHDKDSEKARTLTLQTVGANTADVNVRSCRRKIRRIGCPPNVFLVRQSDYIILASTKIDPQNALARVSGLEVDEHNGGEKIEGEWLLVCGVLGLHSPRV